MSDTRKKGLHRVYREKGKKKIEKSILKPSEALKETNPDNLVQWLESHNDTLNFSSNEEIEGKWIIEVSRTNADEAWEIVKKEIEKDNLWHAKIAINPRFRNHAIIVYVPDTEDLKAVKDTYKHLKTSGLCDLAEESHLIVYKTDKQTRDNIYGKDAYLYTSETINLPDETLQKTYADLNSNSDKMHGFLTFLVDLVPYICTEQGKYQTEKNETEKESIALKVEIATKIKNYVESQIAFIKAIINKEDTKNLKIENPSFTYDETALLRKGKLGTKIAEEGHDKYLPIEFVFAELPIQMLNLTEALKVGNIDKIIYHLFSLHLSFNNIKEWIGENADDADVVEVLQNGYPEFFQPLNLYNDENNLLFINCAAIKAIIQSKLDAIKDDNLVDNINYNILNDTINIFVNATNVDVENIPVSNRKKSEFSDWDGETAVIKHLTVTTPIENVLSEGTRLFSSAKRSMKFKDKLFQYQIEHANEIMEAQVRLHEKEMLDADLSPEDRLKSKKVRKARVAYHFLKDIQLSIYKKPWKKDIGYFNQVRLYKQKTAGQKKPDFINTVTPAMEEMADLIQEAFAKDAEGKTEIWLDTFKAVVKIGHKAAVAMRNEFTPFQNEPNRIQAFYDQFSKTIDNYQLRLKKSAGESVLDVDLPSVHRERQEGISVLSDIDDTLLIRDEEDPSLWRINDNLINSWIEKNVKEITLITNTGLGDLEKLYQDIDDPERRKRICLKYDPNQAYVCIPRPVLVDYLKAKGFTVNAILSGADIGYGKGPGRAFADLLQKDYDDALNYVKGNLEERPKFKKEGHLFEIKKQDIDKHYRTLNAKDEKRDAKGVPFSETDKAKAVAKAKMIKYALENHPEDLFTTDILYSDDEELSLKLVNRQFVTKAPDFYFSAYEVRQKLGEAETQKHYEEVINHAQSETIKDKLRLRHLALLDIDDTLINAQGEYNDALLQALMDEGITDVILFTDMTFRTGLMEDRNKLIDYLNDKGFTVHAVATPLDYLWHADEKILRDFYKAWNKSGISITTMQTPEKLQENLAKLELLLKEHPQVEALISDKNIPPYGVAFNEAKNIYKKHSKELSNAHDKLEVEQEIFTQVRNKSSHVKVISDIISIKRDVKHVKGMMFDQIIEHMPSWVNGIVHVDDKRDALDAVMKAAEESNVTIPHVTTIYVPSNDFDNPASYYSNHIYFDADEIVDLTVSPEEMQTHMNNIANALQENDIDQATYHLFSLNAALEKIKQALGLNDQKEWDKFFVDVIYPRRYRNIVIKDSENKLPASCACLNRLIQIKLANCKPVDRNDYTLLSKMMAVFTDVAKIAMPEVSEVKVPTEIINHFDCQASVIKHLSMKTPIENGLINAEVLLSNKVQVKQKLFKYQTEHAKEIFEAQMILFMKGQTSSLLEVPNLKSPQSEARKRQATIAYHFLKNIQEIIFKTPWVVSNFRGVKVYREKEDGKGQESNTVPPNMAAMASIIKKALELNLEGKNDLSLLNAFNEVAKIGKKAALHKPFFAKRDASVQTFYEQFLNFYINSRDYVNSRKK